MRKLSWLNVLWVLYIIAPALRGDSPASTLLTRNDYGPDGTSQETGQAALSSPVNAVEPWESYNVWQCFPRSDIELTCTEIEYGGWRSSPAIIASSDGHRFEYDVDPTFHWDCKFTLDEWDHTIGDSSEVCLFGAYLQPLDRGASLWVLSHIKSRHSYWREYENESYRRARHGLTEEDSSEFEEFQR